MYAEDDYLALSGIQHFAFCRRQWGLIHIDQEWEENLLTVEGDLMHDRAHNEGLREKRMDVITVRGLAVRSTTLGIVGKCDVVEYHRVEAGHPLRGEDGLWREFPVEYKHGTIKSEDADRLQLCAQAMCLEEMFGSDIPIAYLYYGKTRSRERVEVCDELRASVAQMLDEMHDLYSRRYVPKVPRTKKRCGACSLRGICMPEVASQAVDNYLTSVLGA